jgi:hypothetical protein
MLWTDKNVYYRKEYVSVTAKFTSNNGIPISNTTITFETMFPNNTLWFVWTNKTNEEGLSTLSFPLPISTPLGEYSVYATCYRPGLGNASAITSFKVLNKPPEIHLVKIEPQIINYPGTVEIKVNASDFEDGVNIDVKIVISLPNNTMKQFSASFDGKIFTLNYSLKNFDPTGIYKILVKAKDMDGTLANPYWSSFEYIKLVHKGSLKAVISDAMGSPVFNATLILRRTDVYLLYRNFTDKNGVHVFSDILPGNYTLEVRAKGFAINSTSVEVVENETVVVNLTLKRLPIVQGYVKTKAETPIVGAFVTVYNFYGGAGSNYTDENGFYKIIISRRGTFTVKTSAYSYASNYSVITVDLETVVWLNFTLEKNGIIKGKIRDLFTGAPIENATVYLGKQTYLGIVNFTDQNGNFSFFNVLPGEYVIRAMAKNYLSNSSIIVVASGETVFIDLWLMPAGKINGTIRDINTGGTIAGAKVALIDNQGRILTVDSTDENGTYLLEHVKPNNYTVKVYAYGYNSTYKLVTVKPYITTTLDFYLIPNMIFLNLQIPSFIYSRGENIQFNLTITNSLGQPTAANITEVQLYLLGPTNENITIDMRRVNQCFVGNYLIPFNTTIGVWTVTYRAVDIHGNIGEGLLFIKIAEAFYISFTTSKLSYTTDENVTFYATIARYSNLSRFLNEYEVEVTVQIYDHNNVSLAEISLVTVNNVFFGTYPLLTFNVGNYTAILKVKDSQGNYMICQVSFKVVYDFSILIYTNKIAYNRTETVKIFGYATYETGEPVVNEKVNIRLDVKGYLRTYSTVTDETGYFEYYFVPLGFDAGNYTVNLSTTANGLTRNSSLSFIILGLILKPSTINLKMSMNSANNITITLGNIGETSLTEIKIVFDKSKADGVNATVTKLPKSPLKPGQWSSFIITIAAGINCTSYAKLNLIARSAQGAVEYGSINVYLYTAEPVCMVQPQIIDISLTPDSYSTHKINITNIGYGQMTNVHLTEPDLPWIFTTLKDLGNLSFQENKVFDIIIAPPSNVTTAIYEDQITILSNNHIPVYIYIIVTLTSIKKANLLFHVSDESGDPIQNAEIMLQYQEYYLETFFVKTNTSGYILINNLSIGRYAYQVSKEGYHTVYGEVAAYPEKFSTVEVILPPQIMDVSFKVEPITIQDRYLITLNLTFQTEVPPPILLPVPSVLQYSADRAYVYDHGYSIKGEFSIFNTGTISVSNITLYVDYAPSAIGYRISFLDLGEIVEIEHIEAKGFVRIPIEISVDPGVIITDLPSSLVGKIKIKGSFYYFETKSNVPRRAITTSEVLVYIFDKGDRQLCVNPWAIYGINREGVVSFTFGSWPSRFPDINITNCASEEKVSIFTIAAGGGITLFVGLDLKNILTGKLNPIDVGGFVVFGIITRYGGIPGEEIKLVDAEDTFGWFSASIGGGPLYSLLVQALIMQALSQGVIGCLPLSPSESAILQSESWSIPTSWADLFEKLISFKVRVGVKTTIGGILFSYKWEFDDIPSFYLIPIFIIDVYAPTFSIPIPSGPGGSGGIICNGTVVGIGYGADYVFNPPKIDYVPRPILRKVEPISTSRFYEKVKLSISQQATLERDAFMATLAMTNKLTRIPIQNVNVTLKITDTNGFEAVNNFHITAPTTENIEAINGTGTIDPNVTAIVKWIIIPKLGAGGTDIKGKTYFIQALITYNVNGTQFSVNTTREIINVKPQPLLILDYYIPSRVKANVPFKMAVKVTNIGNGTAYNLQIETAQPVIYENIAELLVDFRIVGSAKTGQPAGNSLKINFGDIPPGTSVIAYWIMVTSMDGAFLNFSASFVHVNELGGIETSLIHSVNTHILMRDVIADDMTLLFLTDINNDGIPDELINSIFGNGTSIVDVDYTVFYEDGAPTMIVNTQKFDGRWIYIEVDDPYRNQKLIRRIVRSDGKVLNPMNYWMANDKIYFVDDPEENYTIFFEIRDIAILNVSLSSRMVTQGEVVTINVTVANEGTIEETFNITIYVDNTRLETESVTLPNGTSITVSFAWNTTGYPEGNYTINANVSLIPGEIELHDNKYYGGIVEIIQPIKPLVIIDRVSVSDYRANVNSLQILRFHMQWENGSDVIGGTLYVNGTGYVTNQFGWITIQANFSTVGNRTWVITGVSCNGVNTFEQKAGNPWIVWDRVNVILTVSDTRIDIGTNISINWKAYYEYDLSIFNGTIILNDTSLIKTHVGKYWFTAQAIIDPLYNLTAFTSNKVFCIWDRVNINLYVEDNRINVGSNATITWLAVYEYDNTPFYGTVALNDTTIKEEVGKYGYRVVSINDQIYNVTVFKSNQVYCIFDKVSITLNVTDARINVGSQVEISWKAFYQFDKSLFKGSITLNDTQTIYSTVGKHGYKVISISDPLYQITTFDSNIVYCIWDRIKIFEGGVSRTLTNITQTEMVWFKAKHEYDGTLIDEERGILFVNGHVMSWSEANKRWEKQFSFSTAGRRTFTVSNVLDMAYNITAIEDEVGSLSITWVEFVCYLTRSPTPQNPIVVNVTTIANAIIIIENISELCAIQVKPTSMPSNPPKGLKKIGASFEINALGNPKGVFRLRIYYSDEELEELGLEEKNLKIYVWNGNQWTALSSHVNPAKNYVETAIKHFSIFALFGSAPKQEHPLVLIAVVIAIIILVSIGLKIVLSTKKGASLKKEKHNI